MTLRAVICTVTGDLVFIQEQRQAACNRPSTKPATLLIAFSEANNKAPKLQTGPPDRSRQTPQQGPYITLVVPDGRCIGHRCFWKQQQNGSIALTRGWPKFYRTYQINLDSMLLFKHKGNSEFQVRIFDFGGRENTYRPRPSKEPPYEAKGAYRRARCINHPSSHKAKVIAQTHKTKWPFFVMDLTDRVLHSCLDTRSSCHTDTLRSRQPLPDLVASETIASGSSPEAGQTLLAYANSSPEVWESSRSCQLSQS
ncbi:hypothetical protein AHAS_Ahas17G0193700 [Arachis hypogaea]